MRLNSEIVYLNDGQILKGSIIKENRSSITLKTRFHTRKIYREHIKRILYGDREMESVNILLKDGELLKGYLVDQDASRVIFREKRETPVERTIPKSDISQLSPQEITLFSPGIYLNAGYFIPLAAGKTELRASPLFMIGAGMNFPRISNTRIALEAGYTKSRGRESSDEYMEFIPVLAALKYRIRISSFHIVPRLGMGLGIVEFNNGEGSGVRSYDLLTNMGVGLVREFLKSGLNAGIWGEYTLIHEERAYKSIVLKAGIGYLF